MNRRLLLKLGIALLAVLVVMLSTVYARQAWSESQARGQFVSAGAGARSELARAKSVGLLPAELAPLQRRLNQLNAQQAPSSLPLWSPGAESFYNAQSRAYRALQTATQRQVLRVTTATRAQAASSLSGLSKQIGTAAQYDLHPTLSKHALDQLRAQFQGSSTPRQYRHLTGAANSAAAHLKVNVDKRQALVKSILSQTQNSLDAIQRRAAGETSSTESQLSLLGLLTTRADTYHTVLEQKLAAVKAQTSPLPAAIQSVPLDEYIQKVSADVNRTVPARMVVVSTENQSAVMYEAGSQVYSTPVTTGGPELPTDHGVFHIYAKISPFVFHSPWPPGSPYYYPPSPVSYWMPFDQAQGLHDAPWRSDFGPGSNLAPTDLGTGNYILGTHGCVNLPPAAAQFLWDWAPIGTTVVVN